MEHSFNVHIAKIYGERCAIIIKHLDYWLTKNKVDNRNLNDGRYWVYFPIKKLAQVFPYLEEAQIRHTVNKLDDEGVILKGNYNKAKFDKTIWYSFSDKFVERWKDHLEFAAVEHAGQQPSDEVPPEPPGNKKQKYTDDSTELKAAKYYFSLIKENYPGAKEPNFQNWATEIHYILDTDKRDKDRVREVMEFVQGCKKNNKPRDEFWYINIRSIKKLREHFEALDLKMQKSNTPNIPSNPKDERAVTNIDPEILRLQREHRNVNASKEAPA